MRQRVSLPPRSAPAVSPQPAGASFAPAAPRLEAPGPAREPAAAPPREGSSSLRAPLFPPARANRTGMPDRLKAGLENLSGLAMDDVRVHYNSPRPVRLRALAYTRGSEIHLAPGQRRHLAHEAWHAVQQKQGRVRPTFQFRGSALNDDSALEREADVMGERAMTGRPREAGLVPVLQPGAPPRGGVVQRRVGFEFEAARADWKIDRQRTANSAWEAVDDTKATLLETANQKGELSADRGNVEFRTKPLSSLPEVTETVNELLGLRDRFRGRTTQLADGERTFALNALNTSPNRYKEVRIRAGQTLITRPQATLGIKVVDIPKLFRKLTEIRGEETPGPLLTRLRREYGADHARSVRTIVGGGVEQNAVESIGDAETIYAAAITGLAEPAGVRDEIVGFLTMVYRIIRDAATIEEDAEDMKYAFPLMARTDLRSMFMSLGANARTFVEDTLWSGGAGPLAGAWQGLDDRLFAGRYKGDDQRYHQGPTKREWLRSIFETGRQNTRAGDQIGRDELSPAPGYNRLEGFGSLGIDVQNHQNLSLLEFRGLATLGGDATIPSAEWLDLAETFFKLTDSVLNPAPAPPAAPPPPLAAAADPPPVVAAADLQPLLVEADEPPLAAAAEPQPLVADADPQPQMPAAALHALLEVAAAPQLQLPAAGPQLQLPALEPQPQDEEVVPAPEARVRQKRKAETAPSPDLVAAALAPQASPRVKKRRKKNPRAQPGNPLHQHNS